MKFDNTLTVCVKNNIEQGLVPMLLGEPGIGKTSWVETLAESMRTKCFTLPCNQLADKVDLTGARMVPVTDNDGNIVSYKQIFYPHAIIHDAIDYAKEHPREMPILFLDELNRTTPDVTSELLSIPTARRIGSITLPNNLKVVTAGNDKGNITSLDDASISRFVLYQVEPDLNTFLSVNPDLNPFVKNTLTAHPDCLICKNVGDLVTTKSDVDNANDNNQENNVFIEEIFSDEESMKQFTTPRTITAISRWLNAVTNQELLSLLADVHVINGDEISVLQEIIEGHVGSTRFTIFLLNEISQNITTINNQSTTISINKPSVYDGMKNCANMSDLEKFIEGLNENEKSGCLLYALYEPEDNHNYINLLVQHMNCFTGNDLKSLISLSDYDKLDSENVKAFINTNAPLAIGVSNLLTLE